MADLVGSVLRARGKHRLLVPIRMPGKAGRAYRAGHNLSRQPSTAGAQTWEAFLAQATRSAVRPVTPLTQSNP
jgi:hypothetical protein